MTTFNAVTSSHDPNKLHIPRKPYPNSSALFYRNTTNNLNICMKPQKTPNDQIDSDKETAEAPHVLLSSYTAACTHGPADPRNGRREPGKEAMPTRSINAIRETACFWYPDRHGENNGNRPLSYTIHKNQLRHGLRM